MNKTADENWIGEAAYKLQKQSFEKKYASYHELLNASPAPFPEGKPRMSPSLEGIRRQQKLLDWLWGGLLVVLTIGLLVASTVAYADQAIRAECEFQMERGMCLVQLDRSDYPAGATHLFIGRKRVSIDAMLMLRSTDNSMCRIAELACQAGASGTELQKDVCHIARSRWGAR